MRIACVHVPQFALQTLTRIDPSLRGAAVAVVGARSAVGERGAVDPARRALNTPVVQACSRAAWSLGVRIGMTATAANALVPATDPTGLRIVTADPQLERETMRAIADVLLSTSAQVDLGGRVGSSGAHLAMYCEVPVKTRGASFGDRLLAVIEALGLTARIGIADDRFTAWVAASAPGLTHAPAHAGASSPIDDGGVVSVPRGGSAAFLSPRPLSLLAITPEVQHMLEALGVATLGEFAALPAPSVSRPVEADFQALCRGDGGQGLRPYVPEAPVREDLVTTPSPAAAIATLARRIALRLAGRGRGATRLELTIETAAGAQLVPLTPTRPAGGPLRVLESAEELAEAIGQALGHELDDLTDVNRLQIVVTGEAIAGDVSDVELTAPAVAPTVEALSVVLASTGSGAWRLTPEQMRDERRDAHRRTRRGKHHRRVRAGEAPIQAWLFAERK